MANPAESEVQNLLPVQAYFDAQGNFVTFIGQNKAFYATPDPQQSGLHITNSTIDSSVIGGITPVAAHFTTATVSTQPVGATDVVNLLALQSYAAGISWKQPCVAATLASITLSGLQDIDGHTVEAGDRVLVKNQGTASQNGIYLASASAWTRALDADSWNELICAISFIEYGTQAGGAWFCTAQAGGIINVTPVNWSQFTTSATYSAGTGLTLTGTVFSITNTGAVAATYGSASRAITQTVNAQGQITNIFDAPIDIAATQIGSGTIDSARLSGSYSGITGLGTLGNLTVTNAIVGSITGNAGTASNLSGGATGSLPYQTAVNTTGFLSASTDGYILSLVSGVPAWIPNTVGTVTAVTASAPLSSSGGSTPNITITQAGTASNGYLSSTDWNTFNGKANSGANSDITSMTGLTGGISTPTFIQWGNGTGQTAVAGKQYYDPATGSHNFIMGGGNITQQVGEELYYYGKASTAITDSPLQIVYKTGTVGASGVITFAPTVSGITDGDLILGVATENLALNAFGRITTFGVVHGITTDGSAYGETWADGDVIWYNPVTGNPTKNKPVAPNIKVAIGTLLKAGTGGSGSIQVEINHGSVLGGTDSNVQLTSATNGNILTYDGGNGYWKNTDLTAGTGISVSKSTNGVLTVASTVTAGLTITDDTTTNATRYLAFTSATSGSITGENVASTKLQFNPSTGLLTSTAFSGSGASLTTLNASNLSSGTVGTARLGSGSASSSTYLRGDGTWAAVTVAPASVSDQANTSTGYFALPSGTTAQRPGSPAAGYTRYNTTIADIEFYNGSAWVAPTYSNYTANYLIVAGGGSGAGDLGGGGGAGGLLTGSTVLSSGTTYSFTVGAGGAASTSSAQRFGNTGSNSTAFSLTALGGGYGQYNTTGGSGGSGGGGGGNSAGGSGTTGQGNAGGAGFNSGTSYSLGGGGGASAVGSSGSGTTGANGGAGTVSIITGAVVTYAGGGGGSGGNEAGGSAAIGVGGAGGGGNGGANNSSGVPATAPTNGTANTGGGGGGASNRGVAYPSGAGGSGIVVISIPTIYYTGTTTGSPTVTTSGSNTILKFTASGSYTA